MLYNTVLYIWSSHIYRPISRPPPNLLHAHPYFEAICWMYFMNSHKNNWWKCTNDECYEIKSCTVKIVLKRAKGTCTLWTTPLHLIYLSYVPHTICSQKKCYLENTVTMKLYCEMLNNQSITIRFGSMEFGSWSASPFLIIDPPTQKDQLGRCQFADPTCSIWQFRERVNLLDATNTCALGSISD